MSLSPTKQITKQIGSRKLNSQEVGVVQPRPQGMANKPQVVNEAISRGDTAHKGRTATNTGPESEQQRTAKERKSVPDTLPVTNGQILRQRSSDSFTLSSSPSEGETPASSEGTSHSEDQRTKDSSFKDGGSSKPVLSSGKSKKSSKKQSKKSKKKDKGHGGQSSSGEQQARSKKVSKRRAYVLERIRSDSLTSSDEEHCLGSSEVSSTCSTDSGTSSLLHQDSILEDGDSAVVDIDKLKVHLQRRIMAKKPPATFETPATQPIFHEVSEYICIVCDALIPEVKITEIILGVVGERSFLYLHAVLNGYEYSVLLHAMDVHRGVESLTFRQNHISHCKIYCLSY